MKLIQVYKLGEEIGLYETELDKTEDEFQEIFEQAFEEEEDHDEVLERVGIERVFLNLIITI